MDTASAGAFGVLLRRYRRAAGLTQEELAERAGLSRRSITDLERGTPHTPRKDTVSLLATALRLSPHERAVFVAAAWQRAAPPHSPAAAARTLAPFVGRAAEMALLERHLAGDGPPLLVLAGEPGIGKTRLLQAAIPHALARGLHVLEGGCQRRGGHEPYAPLLGALRRDIAAQRPAHLRATLQGCAWLVRLLPELAAGPIDPLPAGTLPPEQERRLMFAAVGRYLANVATPAGTLLVLDDLQWAGDDALDLLMALVGTATDVSVRLLGAYRDSEIGPRETLFTALADLAHGGLATHHLVGPLAPDEAAQLLDDLLAGTGATGGVYRGRLLQRAGGVPFVLVSCAHTLRDGAPVTAVDDGPPWTVAQSIRQRVAALPEVGREVLELAAVVGRTTPFALLVAVLSHPEAQVLSGLEAACRGRLLEAAGSGAYQFVHDVIREVVDAEVGEARRMVLHHRVAEALTRGPGEGLVDLLAYHYSRGGAPEQAILYLERAGDQARAQYAHASAVTYYEALVERLDGLGRCADAAAAREKLGAVLVTAARHEAALTVLERAAETYRARHDLESVGRVTAQIGHVYGQSGRPAAGVACVQPVLEHLDGRGAVRELALLATTQAWLFLCQGRYTEQLAMAERGAELARSLGDARLTAEAELWRAEALHFLGRRDEAMSALAAAMPLAEAVDDLYVLGHALMEASCLYEEIGEFALSQRYNTRALAVAERRDDPVQRVLMLNGCAMGAFYAGDWVQARAASDQAVALSRQVGQSWAAVYCLLDRGRLCVAEGAWAEAEACVEESRRLAEDSGDPFGAREAQRVLAERDLLAGQAQAAYERLGPLFERPGLPETAVTLLLPSLAWALLDLGHVEDAAARATEAVARARREKIRPHLTEALRVQALVALRQGRWEEAAAALDEGLVLAQGMPYPYAEARLRHAYGLMDTLRGEGRRALQQLEAALGIFRRLGARKEAARTEQDVASLLLAYEKSLACS